MKEESTARNLADDLRELFAREGGLLSFERFMEYALYHPVHGYYTSQIHNVGGSRADFSTWATLSTLGATIAAWVRHELEFHQQGGQAIPDLIEIGGGDGSLARDLWQALGWFRRRKLRYHLVEISTPLAAIQKTKLRGGAFRWHDSIQSALSECGGRAIIFSNELADAFPVTWLRWNGKQWEEIFVAYDPATGLRESFHPCSHAPDLPHPPFGQRVELHLSYCRWLLDWLPSLNRGSFLTIDYGAPSADQIYRGRPSGTMRGYYQQRRIEGGDIYRRFGRQDLTCDVNFGQLEAWGREAGWQTVALLDLESFTIRFRGQRTSRPEAAQAFLALWQRRFP